MAADIQSCLTYAIICKTAHKDLGFFFPNPANMCAMIGPVFLSAPLSTLRTVLDNNAGDLEFPCMGDELSFLTKSRMQVQSSIESYVSVLDACWPCEYSIPFNKILPSSTAKHVSHRCVILAVVIENIEAKEAEKQLRADRRAAILFEKQREKAVEPFTRAKQLKMPYRNVSSMGAELVAAAEMKQPILKSAEAFGISPAHFNGQPRVFTQPLDVKGVDTDSIEKHPELGDISAEATYLSTCMHFLRVHVERCNTGERYSNGHLLPEFVKGFNQVSVTISALLGGAAEIVANADGPPRRGAFEIYILMDPSSKPPHKWILWSKLEHKQGLPTNVDFFIRRMKEGLSKLFARISVKQLVQNHCRHQWKDWIGCQTYPDDTCSKDDAVTLKFDNSASKLSIKEKSSSDSLLIGRGKKIAEKLTLNEEVQTSEPRIERCSRWACLKEFLALSATVDLDLCCHHPGVFQFRHSQGWWDAHWTCCAQPWEASGCATIQSHLCPLKTGYRRDPEWPHHDAQFHFRPQTSGPRKSLFHKMTRGEVDRRYIITKSEPGEKALREAWNEVSCGHTVISYQSFDEGQLILMKLCHAMKLKELAIFPAARVTLAEIVRRKSLAMIDSNETGVLVYESFRAWWFSKLSMYAAVTELSALENPPLPVQAFMEWHADVDKEKQRIVDFRLTQPIAPIDFAFEITTTEASI